VIELRSDNAAGVAPEILAAIEAANTGSALAYGGDELTAHVQEVVRSVFEHPTARAFPVTSGTAANSLALSAATPPWGAVLCHETAHIITAEGGATSLLSGGAVMQAVGGAHALIEPARLRVVLESVRWGDPHESQPSVLSLTLPSDHGTLYRPDEVAALTAIAREFGLRVHLDGARIANAVAALGCTPADLTRCGLTWQARVSRSWETIGTARPRLNLRSQSRAQKGRAVTRRRRGRRRPRGPRRGCICMPRPSPSAIR